MGIADSIRMLGTFNQHLPMVLFEKYVLYKVFLFWLCKVPRVNRYEW